MLHVENMPTKLTPGQIICGVSQVKWQTEQHLSVLGIKATGGMRSRTFVLTAI